MKNNMIHQFDAFRETKKKAKEEKQKPKGPIDLKETRKVVKDWNKKNRMPS